MSGAVAALAAALLAALPVRAALFDGILGAGRGGEPSGVPNFAAVRPPAAWEAALAQGNPETGRTLYATGQTGETGIRVMVCQSCHGANGVPSAGAPMSRLAGVSADYLAKELFDFQSGRRDNEVMRQIAHRMSPADIGSVAVYLASLPPAPFKAPPASGNDIGRRIQELGDNARAIPACGNCHGPQGQATDQLLPPLAGVDADYLRSQLQEWRSATRKNDDEGVMRAIAHGLTDEEIRSLANYYASVR